jgi:hypothetical protein
MTTNTITTIRHYRHSEPFVASSGAVSEALVDARSDTHSVRVIQWTSASYGERLSTNVHLSEDVSRPVQVFHLGDAVSIAVGDDVVLFVTPEQAAAVAVALGVALEITDD